MYDEEEGKDKDDDDGEDYIWDDDDEDTVFNRGRSVAQRSLASPQICQEWCQVVKMRRMRIRRGRAMMMEKNPKNRFSL